MIEDTENREKLSKLLRFFSSQSEDDLTSLDAYVGRMKPGQKDIFYMAADNVEVRGGWAMETCTAKSCVWHCPKWAVEVEAGCSWCGAPVNARSSAPRRWCCAAPVGGGIV